MSPRTALAPSAAALLLPFLLGAPARAGDGVVEINQACATQTGCLPGDSAGFPVTIGAPGSYLLTGNLEVPDENTTAIRVDADDVTVDLGGFSIRGVTVCTGDPPTTAISCEPTGGGTGVLVDDLLPVVPVRTEVRNGSIVGMGSYGVLIGDGEANLVHGVRAASNGDVGINTGGGGQVIDNVVHRNGTDGIVANPGSNVRGNTASLNGSRGIQAGEGSTMIGNTAYRNGGDGIAAFNRSSIEDNTSSGNGGDGIEAGQGCLVQRNNVAGNALAGLRLDDGTAYLGNVVNGNGSTVVTTSGGLVNLGSNSCSGGPGCP